jgi:hypothetical protein
MEENVMGGSETFSLSGAECVIALCELGFEVARRQPGLTMLRKERRIVLVPDVLVLPKRMVDAILADAGVSLYALLHVLDEIPTNPDVRVLQDV